MRLSNEKGEFYALIDSGASHSLISEERFGRLFSETLKSPEIDLKSVTGQHLKITGACELKLQVHDNLQVTHRFHIVSDSMPYDAIIGLDFLADPHRNIRHELSSYVLVYGKTPIPLYDAKQQQPCSVVTEGRVKGRHQYAGPGAVIFVKVHADSADTKGAECLEFHAHACPEGGPTTLNCLFDARQVEEDELYVGVINHTESGWVIKNNESLGYLVPVNTKLFYDTIAAIETGNSTGEREDTETGDGTRQPPRRVDPEATTLPTLHSHTPYRDSQDRLQPTEPAPDDKVFLETFKYGEDLTDDQLRKVKDMLLEHRDCFALEGDTLGLCNRVTHSIDTISEEPVVSAPYRIPKAQETAVKEIVQKTLDQGLIHKSNSEYSSPVVLVEKPDKSLFSKSQNDNISQLGYAYFHHP